MSIEGVDDTIAATIIMRGLSWPDAFPADDRRLRRATGTTDADALRAVAEQWRPWRGYAALHLWRADAEQSVDSGMAAD
ncbi:MAG: adenosine deaminase, partial [Gemmatimonadaceae bacterium]